MLLPLDAYHYFGILLRDYALCYMFAFIFASHNSLSLLRHKNTDMMKGMN